MSGNPSPDGGTRETLWQKRLRQEARRPRAARMAESLEVRVLRTGLRALRLYNRGVRNVLAPVLKHIEFKCPSLPASFDGFRALHLSDFHFPGPPGFCDAIARLLAAPECAHCDLCVLTGDYAFNLRVDPELVAADLAIVLEPLAPRHGILAVPGNNDTSKMLHLFRQNGLRVLVNENLVIERGPERLYVAGVDDPHQFRSASVTDAVRGVPDDAFLLFLAHSPEAADAAARAGADVYLCGHTHGGQICMPGGRPLSINSRCPRSRAAGTWQLGPMQAFTTRGLGASTIQLRYNCPPDAAIITLKRRK